MRQGGQRAKSCSGLEAGSDQDNDLQMGSDLGMDMQGSQASGRWTNEEHKRFVEAFMKFGRDWNKVAEYVVTRKSD